MTRNKRSASPKYAFLRNDFRTEIPACTAKDCFRVLDKYIGHDLTKLIQEHDLPLVAIPVAAPESEA